jgi:hypothetical protein
MVLGPAGLLACHPKTSVRLITHPSDSLSGRMAHRLFCSMPSSLISYAVLSSISHGATSWRSGVTPKRLGISFSSVSASVNTLARSLLLPLVLSPLFEVLSMTRLASRQVAGLMTTQPTSQPPSSSRSKNDMETPDSETGTRRRNPRRHARSPLESRHA